MINPVRDPANLFLFIWQSLPSPFRSVFYIGLVLIFLYALYLVLSR